MNKRREHLMVGLIAVLAAAVPGLTACAPAPPTAVAADRSADAPADPVNNAGSDRGDDGGDEIPSGLAGAWLTALGDQHEFLTDWRTQWADAGCTPDSSAENCLLLLGSASASLGAVAGLFDIVGEQGLGEERLDALAPALALTEDALSAYSDWTLGSCQWGVSEDCAQIGGRVVETVDSVEAALGAALA